VDAWIFASVSNLTDHRREHSADGSGCTRI